MTSPSSPWRVEITLKPSLKDPLGHRIAEEAREVLGRSVPVKTLQGYCFRGPSDRQAALALATELFLDPVLHELALLAPSEPPVTIAGHRRIDVVRRVGVMEPAAASVARAAQALGHELAGIRAYRTVFVPRELGSEPTEELARKLLANELIEEVIIDSARPITPAAAPPERAFERVEVPLREASDAKLTEISRNGGLALSLVEMQAVRDHYRSALREPTDLELETIAQTWSEHCKHKTLTGPIEADGKRYQNLLKETIFGATQKLARDWCLSVFKDNAGVIAFDDEWAVTFKVETHNHPSALEPYGGAGTGIGGVIRDTLGTGLGAKPILNTDVFCFGHPDWPRDKVPKGALHPKRVMRGVVAGVRDYGNRMGIPTANGAVFFDDRYIGNPLVFCGSVGLLPRAMVEKEVRPGDQVVLIGGRTGRDGIHGATFSSLELHEASETVSSGAVQIGNAIEEKKVLDALLEARDQGLYRSVTDCGAGGLSSAVGEMGAECGALVQLERVPLKYHGLSPAEIWISEAQERMVLGVPEVKVPALLALCAEHDVEAVVIGCFTDTHRLVVKDRGITVGDLDMHFLHDGLPKVTRKAVLPTPRTIAPELPGSPQIGQTILELLALPNITSKEAIIRQYDHEVQAGSVIKSLVGVQAHGPSDACVVRPVLASRRAVAIANGMNPCYGDLDAYRMALAAVDEAIRNLVAVGADPDRIALLDNFAWGNTQLPDRLGSLVRAAEGCHDAALAYRTPFISGKDSLNNEFRTGAQTIAIPPSLLISAIGVLDDAAHTITMDLKEPGNAIVLIGETRDELGGSHYLKLLHQPHAGSVPLVDLHTAPRMMSVMHEAIRAGHVRSCHDLSEGGLGVALAEMCFAGAIGAVVDLTSVPCASALRDDVTLFSESAPRFLLEVTADHLAVVLSRFEQNGIPCGMIGSTKGHSTVVLRSRGTEIARLALDDLAHSFRNGLTL